MNLVDGFDPTDPVEAQARLQILDLLRQTDRPFDRFNFAPGHITGSGIVTSPDGSRALMVHHRRLARWLQPGGHVEPDDADVAETARREVVEETGVSLTDRPAKLIGLDVHTIPAARNEPEHLHHDLCFLFGAGDHALEPNQETLDARWWSKREIDQECEDFSVRRYVTSAFKISDSTYRSV